MFKIEEVKLTGQSVQYLNQILTSEVTVYMKTKTDLKGTFKWCSEFRHADKIEALDREGHDGRVLSPQLLVEALVGNLLHWRKNLLAPHH